MVNGFILKPEEDKKIIIDEKSGKVYTISRYIESGEYYLVLSEFKYENK